MRGTHGGSVASRGLSGTDGDCHDTVHAVQRGPLLGEASRRLPRGVLLWPSMTGVARIGAPGDTIEAETVHERVWACPLPPAELLTMTRESRHRAIASCSRTKLDCDLLAM